VSTYGALIDRTYREWLYPPAEQPARFFLNDSGGISSSDTSAVTNTSWLNPEEEDLLGPGTIVEIERELVLVGSVTGTSPALTLGSLKRGLLGTTAVAHADQVFITLAPEYGRQSVFDAINDSIDDLWPFLWAVLTTIIPTGSSWVDVGEDVEEVLGVMVQNGSGWTTIHAGMYELLIDFPLASSGRAIQYSPGVPTNKGAIIKYKAKPLRATTESQTLVSLNIDPSWERAITVGAAAALLRGADIESASLEFVTESLSQEGFPVGAGENISNALLRYQDFLIQRRARALNVRTPPRRVIERTL
jgi:hypothetical protein